MHFKNERCSGGKFSQVRLTSLAAANATGEKLPMFVTVNSAKPRCFINVKNYHVAVVLRIRIGWMAITEWVRQLANKFVAEDRKIALIINNFPAHPRIDNLQEAELISLSPNTTSNTQPIDQGVIRSLKAHYRAKVVKRYIASIDAKKGIPKASINILNAMTLLVDAWDRVTAATITNCFRKAGISTENQQQSLDDADDPFQALASEIEEIRARDEALIPSEITTDEYIDTDDSLFTFETYAMTDDQILSKVTSIEEDEEDCEYTDEIDLIQTPTMV